MLKEIIKYKKGENDALIKILEVFKPIIKKYSNLLEKEDTEQDLNIHIINVIKKIDINNKDFENDKIIISYISKSIRNEYIRLSKNKSKIINNEKGLDYNLETECFDFFYEIELINLLEVLTEKEAYIIKLIYIDLFSVKEVSDYMKISRQAVNQTKNKALKKLKRYLIK